MKDSILFSCLNIGFLLSNPDQFFGRGGDVSFICYFYFCEGSFPFFIISGIIRFRENAAHFNAFFQNLLEKISLLKNRQFLERLYTGYLF